MMPCWVNGLDVAKANADVTALFETAREREKRMRRNGRDSHSL